MPRKISDDKFENVDHSPKKKVNNYYLDSLSIQEGLEKLRLQSAREAASDLKQRVIQQVRHSTTHPEIASLLSRPAKFNPKPRPAHFIYNRLLGESSRGPAGPPPPASWTQKPRYDATRTKQKIKDIKQQQSAHDPFPDTDLPSKLSLLHFMLLEISCDMRNHCRYNKLILPYLNVRLKQFLLSYVAQYKPQSMTMQCFHILFPRHLADQSVPNLLDLRAQEEDVRLLDLRGLQLDPNFWDVTSFSSEQEDIDENLREVALHDHRFPLLSHLAVRHDTFPLDDFVLRAPLTLTHLSIAYTTIPIDLLTLSKTLVSLKWLDMSGCNWVSAHNRWPSIQFDRGWRTVAHVVMKDVAFIHAGDTRIIEQDRINRLRGPSRLCTLEIIITESRS